MKICRDGKEYELTFSEMIQANEEYKLDCMIEDVKEQYETILEEDKAYYVEIEEEESDWTGNIEIDCYVYLFDDEGKQLHVDTWYTLEVGFAMYVTVLPLV